MYPRLLELGPVTVYTYGVLLAAAYLLGLQLAMVRAPEPRASTQTRVLDLGIYIIISALVGAKLLLLIVDFRTFVSDPRELLSLVRSGGVFYGGLILAVVVALWYIRQHRAAALDDVRRLRAGHRARPRRRPPRLPLRRLLLRQADDDAVGASRSPTRSRPPTSARRSACRCTRRSSTRPAPKLLILAAAAGDREDGPAVPGTHVLALHAALRASRGSSSSSTAATRAARCGMFSTSQFISLVLAPLSVVMLVYLARRAPPAPKRRAHSNARKAA